MKISSFHFIRLDSPEGWSDEDLYDYELQCIEFAEEFGLDGVWLAEHHFRSDVCPSTIPFAAYVAARTKRIRIGLGVLLLPLYDPLRLAEDVAVVDQLSKGRLDVGLGRGYNEMEFNALSVSFDERRSRYAEVLDVLMQAWTKGKVNHHGENFSIDDVAVFPTPLQRPHPPLWVAASSTDTVKICGSMGVPFLSDPAQTVEQTTELVGAWTASAKHFGHDPSDSELTALRPVWVAESLSEALNDHPVWVPRSLEEPSPPDPFDPGRSATERRQSPGASNSETVAGSSTSQAELEEIVRQDTRYIVGDPDSVVSKIKAHADAGFSHIIGVFNSETRLPLEKVRKTMELFSKEVLPRVKSL